jgi:hypothetical protein
LIRGATFDFVSTSLNTDRSFGQEQFKQRSFFEVKRFLSDAQRKKAIAAVRHQKGFESTG